MVLSTFLPAQGAPQNIILFIGDGMGPEQVMAASFYNGGPLSFEGLPYQGAVTTHSADNSITDSAAAATAIATGVKVNNGVVSLALPGDGSELETLLEMYQKRGKKTGLITTAYLTHATPAGFGAHETNRGNYTQIGADLLNQTQPDILFGGGGNGLDAVTTAGSGYDVATDTAGFNSLDPAGDRLAGLFGTDYMPYEEDYLSNPGSYPYPHLSDMVSKALDALEEHPDGFFLMVEAGRIDHACHSNLLPEAVHEALELGNAVQVALDWMAARTDTLVIVTADHETGGLDVLDESGTAGTYPAVSWSSTGHSGANVPVYATGPHADLLPALMDNTEFVRLCTLEGATQPIIYRVSVRNLTDASATIVWATDEASDSVVEYRDAAGGTWLSVSDPQFTTTHSLQLGGLTPGSTYEYRVGSYNGSVMNYSATYSMVPVLEPGAPRTLVAEGSGWKYLDDGSDQGTAWSQPGFNDSSWASGLAELGYGDGDEATIVSYGADPNNKFRTTYFRHTFSVADPAAYGVLSLRLLRDDGAVVYLNGTEVQRVNMPAAPILHDTLASSASDYAWDTAITLPNTLLTGGNVLAVEVHQGSATSSDLSFDLELTAPDANDVQIIKGPWLQNVTANSIVVMWETDAPIGGRVDYGLFSSDEAGIVDDTPVTIHEITLGGLEPNTTYRYTVSSGYATSTEVPFTTAPAPGADDSFRFAVYSDTQTNPGDHGAVVDAMLQHDPLPRFVLHAGDLVDDGQIYGDWGPKFFTPSAGLIARAPVFPALGNHEYSGTGRMWFFDFFNLPDNGSGPGIEEWYAFTYGNMRILCLNTNAAYTPSSDQYNWLVSELNSTEARSATWRIAFFHHPTYSNAPTADVQTHLVPLFHEHGVHLVFNGHNHNYRHVERMDPVHGSTVSYLITGGGGAPLADLGTLVSDPTLTQIAAEKVLHHCLLDVSPTTLGLSAYRNDGSVIDSLQLVVEIDSAPPVISDVGAETTETTATISWSTDEVSDSMVEYRVAGESAWQTVADPGYAKAHSLTISDLAADTLYEYRVTSTDTSANSATVGIATFTTDAVNLAPVADDQDVVLDEDGSTPITLTGSDPNAGDVLSYVVTAAPSSGTLTGTPPQLTYTPAPDFNGLDSFHFVVNDGTLDSPPAIVTIMVRPVNDPPSAPTGLIAAAGDGRVDLSWQPGADPDGDDPTYSVFRDGAPIATDLTATSHSDTTAVNDTEYSYFVRIVDSSGLSSDSAPVSATPRGIDPNAYATRNPTIPVGTLSGDDFSGLRTTGDGSAQTLSEVRAGLYGRLEARYLLQTVADLAQIDSVTLHVTYSLAADDAPWRLLVWNGDAWTSLGELPEGTTTLVIPLDRATTIAADGTIQIAIMDGGDGKKEAFDSLILDGLYAAVAIGVPNLPPVAVPNSVSTLEDTAVAITLTASDPEGGDLSYGITAAPAHGSLSGTLPDLTYTPASDFNGTDSFQFVAHDGRSSSTPATVDIAVSPVNDPPLASAQSVSTNLDTPIAITLGGTDVDGGSLSYSISVAPSHGTISNLADDQATYTPDTGFTGVDSFDYTVVDGLGGSASATITITITDPSGAPTIHVASIVMDLVPAGKNLKSTAMVTIVDQDGQPVVGASVTGDWTYSGDPIGSVSGLTDPSGAALLSSAPVKKATSGSFTFTVTDVALAGADYDPGANAVTAGTIGF